MNTALVTSQERACTRQQYVCTSVNKKESTGHLRQLCGYRLLVSPILSLPVSPETPLYICLSFLHLVTDLGTPQKHRHRHSTYPSLFRSVLRVSSHSPCVDLLHCIPLCVLVLSKCPYPSLFMSLYLVLYLFAFHSHMLSSRENISA